jgi:hypothetical protein
VPFCSITDVFSAGQIVTNETTQQHTQADKQDSRPLWRKPQLNDVLIEDVTLAGGVSFADQDPNQPS